MAAAHVPVLHVLACTSRLLDRLCVAALHSLAEQAQLLVSARACLHCSKLAAVMHRQPAYEYLNTQQIASVALCRKHAKPCNVRAESFRQCSGVPLCCCLVCVCVQAMPGLLELCSFLDSKGIPRGLITRNVLRSVHFFHDHHLPLPPFVPAISRECQFPYKPSPDALLHICDSWGIPPSEVIMIGDSAKDDVVCGNRAGAVTILLDTEGRYANESQLQGECKPTATVTSLAAFLELLRSAFDLLPPAGLPQQQP